MFTSLSDPRHVCCVCECQESCTGHDKDLVIIQMDLVETIRKELWGEIGPDYHDRLTEEKVNQVILGALPEDAIEQIKEILEEEETLQKHDGVYIVNAMPR